MKLNEFQEKAMSYCPERSSDPVYGAIAEAAYKFATPIRPKQFSLKELEQWHEELAKKVFDELWFAAVKACALGYTLEQLAELGFNKLQSRKERGVIVGDDDNDNR